MLQYFCIKRRASQRSRASVQGTTEGNIPPEEERIRHGREDAGSQAASEDESRIGRSSGRVLGDFGSVEYGLQSLRSILDLRSGPQKPDIQVCFLSSSRESRSDLCRRTLRRSRKKCFCRDC